MSKSYHERFDEAQRRGVPARHPQDHRRGLLMLAPDTGIAVLRDYSGSFRRVPGGWSSRRITEEMQDGFLADLAGSAQ